MIVDIRQGDLPGALAGIEDDSVAAIFGDPPYALGDLPAARFRQILAAWLSGEPADHLWGSGFLNRKWDTMPGPEMWAECYRILKPGGHAVLFTSSRTYGLLDVAVRLAGFEILPAIAWIYAQAMALGMDVSKAIDAAAGAEREAVGVIVRRHAFNAAGATHQGNSPRSPEPAEHLLTAPATDLAAAFDGYSTRMRSMLDLILVARKPHDGTVAANAERWGVAGLNVGACRIPRGEADAARVAAKWSPTTRGDEESYGGGWSGDRNPPNVDRGQLPGNVILSHSEKCGQECAPPETYYDLIWRGSALFVADLSLDMLLCLRGDLATHSTSYTDRAHNGAQVSNTGGKRQAGISANVTGHVDLLELLRGSLCGCPSCRRFCGEHEVLLVNAARDGAPSLRDALDGLHLALLKSEHTRREQRASPRSSYDAAGLEHTAGDTQANKTSASCLRASIAAPAPRNKGTDQREPLPLEPRPCMPASSISGPSFRFGISPCSAGRRGCVLYLIARAFYSASLCSPVVSRKHIIAQCPVRGVAEMGGGERQARVVAGDRPHIFSIEGRIFKGQGVRGHNDVGTSDRFFYQARAGTAERLRGLEGWYWRRAPDTPEGWERVPREEWEAIGAEAEMAFWQMRIGRDDAPTFRELVKLMGSTAEAERTMKAAEAARERDRHRGSPHQAHKPLALLAWLARLILPPTLDPDRPPRVAICYSGSGSEVIGALYGGWRHVTAIEGSPVWVEMSRERVAWWQGWLEAGAVSIEDVLAEPGAPESGTSAEVRGRGEWKAPRGPLWE